MASHGAVQTHLICSSGSLVGIILAECRHQHRDRRIKLSVNKATYSIVSAVRNKLHQLNAKIVGYGGRDPNGHMTVKQLAVPSGPG